MKKFVINARSGGGSKSLNASITVNQNYYKRIQTIVREGKAREFFDIGDEITTNYTYGDTVFEMPWVVLDNDRECEWANGTKHPGLWLGAKYATAETIQFDQSEQEEATEEIAQEGLYYVGKTGSTITELNLSVGDPVPYDDYDVVWHSEINNKAVFSNGYDRYSHSAIRQWLNSKADKGGWWTPQHIGDCAPEQLETVKGFMAGLDNDFINIIHPVKVQALTNSVTDGRAIDIMYDRFFAQSIEEVYGAPYIYNIEGPYFPYWKQVTGLSNPTNGSSGNINPARNIRKITSAGSYTGVFLRSSKTSDAYTVCTMIPQGYIATTYKANSHLNVLPACVIS